MKNCFIDFFQSHFVIFQFAKSFYGLEKFILIEMLKKAYIKLTLIKLENWRNENKFNSFYFSIKNHYCKDSNTGRRFFVFCTLYTLCHVSFYLSKKKPSVSMVKMIQRNLRNKKYN